MLKIRLVEFRVKWPDNHTGGGMSDLTENNRKLFRQYREKSRRFNQLSDDMWSQGEPVNPIKSNIILGYISKNLTDKPDQNGNQC